MLALWGACLKQAGGRIWVPAGLLGLTLRLRLHLWACVRALLSTPKPIPLPTHNTPHPWGWAFHKKQPGSGTLWSLPSAGKVSASSRPHRSTA